MDTIVRISVVAIAISQAMMCGQIVDWPKRLSQYTLKGEFCGEQPYNEDGVRRRR